MESVTWCRYISEEAQISLQVDLHLDPLHRFDLINFDNIT